MRCNVPGQGGFARALAAGYNDSDRGARGRFHIGDRFRCSTALPFHDVDHRVWLGPVKGQISGTVRMSDKIDQTNDVPDERLAAWGDNYRPRYSGVATFMRQSLRESESDWQDVDVGLIGVPFDGGVTNRPGARHGPRALREQSTLMGRINGYGYSSWLQNSHYCFCYLHC